MIKRLFAFVIVAVLPVAALAAAPVSPPREEAIALDTASGQLAGTLQLPVSGGRVPVALIIAGSGPTDRDGNSGMLRGANNSLKMLSQALADAGYASLRYDKRGIGASQGAGPKEADLRFDAYVDDAAGWLAMLKADARFSSAVVIGHSEGSLIGMVAANKARADAFVSVAGAGQSAQAILRWQMAGKLPPELAAENERILSALERGELAGEVPAVFASAYRPSVQPYLVSWFKYVPAERIAALDMPVLIVQGTTDIQVSVDQANALKKAKPQAVLAIIPGMNHVLKLVPPNEGPPFASYGDPSLPLAPELVTAVTGFMRAVSSH